MNYIKVYKIIYITFLIANIPLVIFEEPHYITSSFPNLIAGTFVLSLNVFTLILIFNKKLSQLGFLIEKFISFYRLGGIFLAGSIFGLYLLYYSPVSISLWIPLMTLMDGGKSLIGLIVWYSILFLLLIAEVINYKKLKSNKISLMENI